MKRFCILATMLIFVAAPVWAEVFTLEDANVKVELDTPLWTLSVTEKSSSTTWRQVGMPDDFTLRRITKEGDTIKASVQGNPAFDLELKLSKESDLLLTLTPNDPKAEFNQFTFPAPFSTPSQDYSIVLPDAEGLLVRAGDKEFPMPQGVLDLCSMGGLIMPWVGVTDAQLKCGYMLIVDTFDDSGIQIVKANELYAPAVVWEPSMQKFSYPRKMRYHFFSTGGYVAQAKYYREYVKRERGFRSFDEKLKNVPDIEKLFGAVHIYLWSDGRTNEFVKGLKDAGIKKAWIGWDPSHPPYPAEQFDVGVKELGYLSGTYDLYRDMYDHRDWDKKVEADPVMKTMSLHRYWYPGLFPEIAAKLPNGEPLFVGMSGGNLPIKRYFTCTKAVLPHMRARIDKELALYPHNSYFLDVSLAAQLIECYDKEHPMTRSEDREARLSQHKLYVNDLKLVLGSEFGADYGIPYTDFLHGVMTLHHYRGKELNDKNDKEHYMGGWADLEKPDEMLKPIKATDMYVKYGMGEQYRIPLFELVYHDSTVSSWRWEDNNHKETELWEKKDLFNILYGTAPQWNLDKNAWAKNKEQFVKSYKTIAPVLDQVAKSEMINHKFLNDDRTAQECEFLSATVIANFGNNPYTISEGIIVPAKGHLVVRK